MAGFALMQEAAVPRLILAAVSPDNTPHGYNWTFAFPMLLLIIIGAALYFLFSRPHRRVPSRRVAMTASTDVPTAEAARSAAIVAGLSTAPGGGTTESHLEGPGAHLTAAGHAEPVEIELADTERVETEPGEADPAETDPGASE
jgi:hypothetical protein